MITSTHLWTAFIFLKGEILLTVDDEAACWLWFSWKRFDWTVNGQRVKSQRLAFDDYVMNQMCPSFTFFALKKPKSGLNRLQSLP